MDFMTKQLKLTVPKEMLIPILKGLKHLNTVIPFGNYVFVLCTRCAVCIEQSENQKNLMLKKRTLIYNLGYPNQNSF